MHSSLFTSFIFFVLCDTILSDNLDGTYLSRHRTCTVGHTSCLLCITKCSFCLAWPCICCADEDRHCSELPMISGRSTSYYTLLCSYFQCFLFLFRIFSFRKSSPYTISGSYHIPLFASTRKLNTV